MWHKLLSDEMSAMHTHAYQWYSDWSSKAAKPNYKYLEEAVRHALAVDNIRGACPHARALGRYFNEMVLYREGRAIMKTVAVRVSDAVIAEAKATKDVAVGNFLHEYAYSLKALGDPKQAIAFYEKALAIFKEVYGEGHPSVATVRGNMAAVSDKAGDP
ncbi:MAG: tetratricopeptide repeat protein [Candidatus Magnetobacterium sp. LHC-1]